MRAARRLGFGDAARVTPALTAALSDPDPDVVVEVIEALAFVGEPDAIASLEALSEHESPAVRAAVQDAIEVLR
jgi:HEAT repeat protein